MPRTEAWGVNIMQTIVSRRSFAARPRPLAACLALASGALLAAPALGQAIPAVRTWLVFNNTLNGIQGIIARDNGYNAACTGWSFQQAGLLAANGSLLPRDGMGNILNMAGGQIIGQRVFGGGGFVNTTSSVGVADLSGGATLQGVYDAMLPFAGAMDGVLHISSHGPGFRDRNGALRNGGSLILDNNVTYSGFRRPGTADNGTGVRVPVAGQNQPIINPYAIAAAAQNVGAAGGGRFRLELYNCNSGLDPDGAGALRSVAATGATGFGQVMTGPGMTPERVTETRSSAPVVFARANALPTSGNIQQNALILAARAAMAQRAQAVAVFNARRLQIPPAMRPPAMQNPFGNMGDPMAWINTLPFDQQFNALNTHLGTLRIGNQNVNVNWGVAYEQPTGLNDGEVETDYNSDFPVIWENSTDGARITYTPVTTIGLGADFIIDNVSPGALSDGNPPGAVLHLGAISDFDITPPADDLALATAIMKLSPYGMTFGGVTGVATLDYGDWVTPENLELYRFVGDEWVQFSGPGNRTLDEMNMTITANFSAFGDFDESGGVLIAGFAGAIPAPGGVVLLGLVGLIAARRRR